MVLKMGPGRKKNKKNIIAIQENPKYLATLRMQHAFPFSPRFPTGPFTMLEPQDQEIGEFYVAQKRRATDFKLQNCERVSRVASKINIS